MFLFSAETIRIIGIFTIGAIAGFFLGDIFFNFKGD